MTGSTPVAAQLLSGLTREVPGAEPVTDTQIGTASFISPGRDSLRALHLVGAAAFCNKFCPNVPELPYGTGDLVRLDAAGRVRFLARRDHGVKVRGFRTEFDEIRAAIMSSPASVSDCLVLTAGPDSSSRQLVSAVAPAHRRDRAGPDQTGSLPVGSDSRVHGAQTVGGHD